MLLKIRIRSKDKNLRTQKHLQLSQEKKKIVILEEIKPNKKKNVSIRNKTLMSFSYMLRSQFNIFPWPKKFHWKLKIIIKTSRRKMYIYEKLDDP